MKVFSLLARLSVILLTVICAISLLSFSIGGARRDEISNLLGDTTHFIANSAGGWIRHSSYLEQAGDSVRFEVILFRNVPEGTNWADDSQVGIISGGFEPSAQVVFDYYELPRTWKITIEPNGKCSFRLINGPSPQGQPVVLPMITHYKKS